MKTAWFVWILFLAVKLAAQTITTQPTNQAVLAGGNVAFSVAVSGTGPFTYQWQFNGTNLPSGIITTVAGNGAGSFSGDGIAATNAALNNPSGVAVDAGGNLFIADFLNNRIRKVNTNGIITTIAGGGNSFPGDGGFATSARLAHPSGVALDSSGNLFIADLQAKRISKVDTNGIITTVAGGGLLAGNFADGGLATNALFSDPVCVAVDANGNIFIADEGYNDIRKVTTNGIITTVTGNSAPYGGGFSGDGGLATAAQIYSPTGVAVDAKGNLFIADDGNGRIRKVDTNKIISTVAGNGINPFSGFSGDGGAATNAEFNEVYGVAADTSGNLFIADNANFRIRRVDAHGTITTVAGNGIGSFSGDGGAATNSALSATGVAVDVAGNLFIADSANNRIRKVSRPSYLLSLVLNTVSKADAGNYSVIITSSSGSVTSSVVALKVVSLNITAPTILGNGHSQFSFDTAIGVNYAVQYSTNLTQWFPFVTLGGIGVPLTLIDPNTAASQQRFYRFVLSPQ